MLRVSRVKEEKEREKTNTNTPHIQNTYINYRAIGIYQHKKQLGQ